MSGSDRAAGGGAPDVRRGGAGRDAPRVLMTADTVGGVWTYALELAGAVVRRGGEVVLATMGELPDPAQRAAAGELPGIELVSSSFRLEWMEEPWDDVARAGAWLLELERSRNPDVVHLNGYAHGRLPFSVPTLVVGHSCVLSWWEAVHGEEAPPRYDRYRGVVADGLAGADAVAAPTRAMLDALGRHYGHDGDARVVPNGRSPERFRPGTKRPVVLACGRLWDAGKNLSALEDVAPELPWPVEVAGSLRHPEAGERAASHVRSLGTLPPQGVARRMARASICAHPARYEPFGLVPLEAALSGCALVLGDIASLREVWGDAALYVDPEDADALRGALRRLIDAPGHCRRMARKARRRALRLTPARMADAYLRLYRRLGVASAAAAATRSGDAGREVP